jgi:hypothetical protein
MKRRRGNLPGRYVSAHLRKNPYEPGQYIDVAAYQERITPTPSPTELVSPQADFESIWNATSPEILPVTS